MKIGDHVKLHPATDWWMRGATTGKVVKIGRKWVHVQLITTGAGLIKKVVRFQIGSDLIETIERK
jgi:hypothetical protein